MNKHTRKTLVLAVVVGLAAWAAPAAAELDLLVEIDKTKTVDVTVNIKIVKKINVTISVERKLDGAAEAMANLNVENMFNIVGPCGLSCWPEGPYWDEFGVESNADLINSIRNNKGVVGANQDVGNMANQANVLALARAEFGRDANGALLGETVADAQAEIDQVLVHNLVAEREKLPPLGAPLFGDPDHSATIKDSINQNKGVVGFNQNSGSVNNQSNGVAFSIGEGHAVVLAEAALGQVNAGNVHASVETSKIDMINNSINGNDGIVSVNQSSGNMNNQAVAVAFGALTTSATVGVPGS